MKQLIETLGRRPLTCIWEITNACNLRCLHCEGSAGARDPEELTTEEALALCDALAALGCRTCNLSGGEPLLRRDWSQLAQRLSERGVAVHLVTNGTRLDQAAVDLAAAVGVTGIALSLDGLPETHDRIRVSGGKGGASAFGLFLDGIARVVRSPVKAGVITHINAWNLRELDAMYELLVELGPDVWQLQLALPAGRLRELGEPYLIAPEQLEDVYECLVRFMQDDRVPIRVTDTIGYYTELEPVVRAREDEKGLPYWTGCYAGCMLVAIESNGAVLGCPSMPKEFIVGNVRDEPLAEIWQDEERFAYNTRWDESKLTGYCAECAYRRICRAGCTSLAYAVTGTIYDQPYCLHRVREQKR
ncbi:MAG: radical SAM protein [bacterium]